MPRPVEQQKVVVRATPAPQSQAPQLGVYAPIDGVRAPQTSAWQGLAQSLGMLTQVGGPILQDRAQAAAKADAAAGQADQELNQVDAARAARSRAYADAAQDTSVLQQYHQAESAVLSRAATELDHSKPYTEQTAQIDQWMKQELGGLAKDPRAKVLIADRYQKFIDNTAHGLLKQQIEARQNDALSATQADIADQFSKGVAPDYGEAFQRLKAIYGDGTQASSALVGIYADHAVDVASKGGDWRQVFDALPTEIKLPDGNTIPGPGRTPKNHDLIERAKDAAQRAFEAWDEPRRNAQQLGELVKYERLADQGALLTVRGMVHLTQPGQNGEKPLFSADTVASLIDRSARRREALAQERFVQNAAQYLPNWQTMLNQKDPADPTGRAVLTKDMFQKAYDRTLSTGTNGFQDPDTVDKAIALTQAVHGGLVSSTLQAQLASSANRSTSQEALKMLPVYQKLRAAGQESLYLSPDQQAFYENLVIRKRSGATDADIVQAASRYDAREASVTVEPNMKAAREALKAQKMTGTGWFGTSFRADTYGSVIDDRMVNRDADRLLRRALVDNGGNAVAAAQVVAATIDSQWMPIDLAGKRTIVPRTGRAPDGSTVSYDQTVLQHALSTLSDVEAPKIAQLAGASNYKTARFRIVAMPDGDTEVEVTDDVGNPIPGAAIVPFYAVYRRAETEYRNGAYRDATQAKSDAQSARNADPTSVLLMNGGLGR